MRLNFDSIIFLDTHLGSRFYSYITFLLQFLGSSRQIIACCFTNIRAKSFEKDLILNNLRNNYPPSPSITTIHVEIFQKNLSSTNSSTISTRKTIFPIFQLPRAITFAFSVLHPSHACKKPVASYVTTSWPRPSISIHPSIHPFRAILEEEGLSFFGNACKIEGRTIDTISSTSLIGCFRSIRAPPPPLLVAAARSCKSNGIQRRCALRPSSPVKHRNSAA